MSSIPADFTPIRRLIASVSREKQAEIETIEAHGYITGSWVRVIVPDAYGMDLEYIPTTIEVLTSTTFKTQIDTRNQLPFVTPNSPFTEAQVVPISQITTVVDP